jgi:hypothetical protein
MLDVIPVKVHDTATVNLQTDQLTAMALERDVVELLILDVIGAFNLYDVPGFIYSRAKDVDPAIGADCPRSRPQIASCAAP